VRDQLQLQAVIIAWSLTAILGKLIALPVPDMLVWRTAASTLGFAILALWLGQPLKLSVGLMLRLLGVGAMLGFHWVLFFQSARVSTASVSLAAMPTLLIWGSLMEPWFYGGKKVRIGELIVGAIIVAAVSLIYQVEFRYAWGFSLSLLSVGMAAVFAVANKGFTAGHHFSTLCTWQMAGAFLAAYVCLPFMEGRAGLQVPQGMDILWLAIFTFICTVVAYGAYVDVLRRVSVFTANVMYNLEPIYGIVLATWVFGSSELMRPGFYWGAAIILASVVCLPLIRRWVGDKD
jgi:drug/metabolite transporter (DMT)-like permease